MRQVFENNASALLAASLSDSDTTVQVGAGFGALFPNPGASEYFLVTLENELGDIEVCRCTARVGDNLTVTRAQEGTSAQAWTNGQTRVELRNTKGTMEVFLQRGGDSMSGPLDMQGNEVQNARLTGTTVMDGGIVAGASIRGDEGDASNELIVPSGGGRPTIGGAQIVLATDNIALNAFPVGSVILWYGAAANVPSGWQICNGTNGTPDLRDKFVIGAGSTYTEGGTGGAATASPVATAAGGHGHGDVTGEYTLTAANIPAHNHDLWVWTDGGQGNAENFGTSSARGIAGNNESNHTYAYRNTTVFGQKLVKDYGAGVTEAHDHSITPVPDHTHAIASIPTVPPFVALYYIMRV
jgi:hypothetical protein